MTKRFEFSLQDALFIGLCATLLVALKGMLRLKLGISGHTMLLMSFMYLTCYGVVGRLGSITLCGTLAGLVAMALGVGKGGPMILLKFALPALAMDVALLLVMAWPLKWRFCVLVVSAAIAWAGKVWLTNMLAGMAIEVALIKFAISVAQGTGFGLLGAALAFALAKRLQAHDLLKMNIKE
ncbi:core component of ECF transporter [Shewanella corallii]|uniref:Core component of ECF transporter n=1 Tax=Shewanella corallii TaxID=560080 RepID=A0ABT0NAD9_9GAMM|nr:core component of ECF transporter [Shewanella corallii]MCL2915115.1 core component of ECF transporter [Shewanella corallii]